MKCPKCRFENREEAKFYKQCGAKLELKCSSCGDSCERNSLFCDQCGQRLSEFEEESATARFNGERKHVTVLFSDLSGDTSMTERLDPEEVKEITTRLFGDIAKVIERYEGFIEKYAGDTLNVASRLSSNFD